jgi:DNA-binding NarL/FixJ family response regulator
MLSGFSVVIVEDREVVSAGLRVVIQQKGHSPNVMVAAGRGAAATALESMKVDLAVVDLSVSSADGIETIKDLRARYPEIPILATGFLDERIFAERAMRAGARGYIMLSEDTASLLEAARAIANGGTYVSNALKSLCVRRLQGVEASENDDSLRELTDRELEVFYLLGRGKDSRSISDALGMSVKTVESHREHIKKKLSLANATQLIHYATLWSARVDDPQKVSLT